MPSAPLFTLFAVLRNSSYSAEMVINLETNWAQSVATAMFLLMAVDTR